MPQTLRNSLLAFLSRWWPQVVISVVILLLACLNFEWGTRSLSWDVMDSSFNPSLHIARSLSSTWQSFQGLGLLGGHGYIAQLPHALTLWLLAFIVPEQSLRFVFAFLMLWAGSLGSYQLSLSLGRTLMRRSDSVGIQLAALLGALTYVLHFSTVQTFYVHLEPFIIMYGLLPWALMLLFSVLAEPSTKKYLLFLVFNFGLSAIGFIPPVFVSYLLFVGLACLGHIWFRPDLRSLKQCLMVGTLVIIANLYWLTGVAFFTLFQPNAYLDSKLNQLTTSEFILKNELYGTPSQLLHSQSFYADSLDQNRFGTPGLLAPILQPWLQHFESPIVKGLSATIFCLSLVGLLSLLVMLLKKRDARFSIVLMALVTLAALGTGVPILNLLSAGLRTIPFLNQAFRIPFSKFSMSMALWYSLGLSFSFVLLFESLKRVRHQLTRRSLQLAIASLSVLALTVYAWPAWRGHFLYAGSRVVFPAEYQQLFQALDKVPSQARIANFPILTSTGWNMHNWSGKRGYTGSGFYWYATPHTYLDRAFDVWSPANETYRNEMANAVYAQDVVQFQHVLEKYDVSHILIDKTIYVADNPQAPLYLTELETLITKMPELQPVHQTESLKLYALTNKTSKSKLFAPSALTYSTHSVNKIQWDRQFELTGDYLQHSTGYTFPFQDLTKETISDVEFGEHTATITKTVNALGEQSFVIPNLRTGEVVAFNVFALTADGALDVVLQPILPEFKVNDKTFIVNQPQVVTFPATPDVNEVSIDVAGKIFTLAQTDTQQLLGQIYVPFGNPLTVRHLTLNQDQTAISPESFSNQVTLGEDFWGYYQAFGLPLPTSDSYQIQAEVPIQKASADLQKTIFPQGYNCDYQHQGLIQKSSVDTGVRYEAEAGAAICDGISLSQLPMDVAYVVHVTGTNHSGLSPRFLIKNEASGRIVNEQVLAEADFDQTFIISPSYPGAKGVTVNWEIRSYGREKSSSTIKSIDIYTLPLSTLAGTHLKPMQTAEVIQPATNLQPTQLGSGWYTLTGSFAQPTWIVLSEAFDQYWIAVDTNNLFKLLPHTLYNGWANAWQIPAGTATIRIIYLPQLLSWFGYGILGLTGLTLVGVFYFRKFSK